MVSEIPGQASSPAVAGANARRGRLLLAAALLALSAVAIGLLATIIRASWLYAAAVPIADEWTMGNLLIQFDRGTLALGDLWAVHNEHRIVMSRLISLPLVVFFDWNRFAHLLVALAVVLISLSLLMRAAWQSVAWKPAAVATLFPIVALGLSLTRLENWTLPFTDKIPTVLGVSLTMWALSSRAWGRSRFAWAIGGALVASLSSLSGLLIWPAFAPALFVAGRRWGAGWISAAIITLALYVQGYASARPVAETLPPRPGFADCVGFLLANMGAPIGYPSVTRSMVFGAVAGVVLLLALLVLIPQARRDQRLLQDVSIWLGAVAFAGASGVAILVGRAGEFGQSAAIYSRFHAFSSLSWMAAFVLVAMAAGAARRPAPRATRPLVWISTALLLCAVCSLAVANWMSVTIMRGYLLTYQTQQACVVVAPSASDACLSTFYRDTDLIRTTVDYLFEHDRGFAADTISIPSHGVPTAVAYAHLPVKGRRVFRCNKAGEDGSELNVDVPIIAQRAVCFRAANPPWTGLQGFTRMLGRQHLCVVPRWETAGVWREVADGSQWCLVDWEMGDERAASLLNENGNLILHAYFPNGGYIPFADGRPARWAEPPD